MTPDQWEGSGRAPSILAVRLTSTDLFVSTVPDSLSATRYTGSIIQLLFVSQPQPGSACLDNSLSG